MKRVERGTPYGYHTWGGVSSDDGVKHMRLELHNGGEILKIPDCSRGNRVCHSQAKRKNVHYKNPDICEMPNQYSAKASRLETAPFQRLHAGLAGRVGHAPDCIIGDV